jgi:hypothetical protein
MVTSDAEVREFRWNNRLGIYGKQEFSWTDSRLKRYAVFDHVDEHPTLSLGTINGPQRGIYGVGCRNAVPSLMEESGMTAAEFFEEVTYSGFESRGFRIQEVRRPLINESEPRRIILIGIADVDVALGNQLLDRSDDLGSVFRRKSLLR